MPRRIYKTPENDIIDQADNILMNPVGEDQKFLGMVRAVKLVVSGEMQVTKLAKYYHISRATISSWLTTVDEIGFDGLRPKPKKGRPPRV